MSLKDTLLAWWERFQHRHALWYLNHQVAARTGDTKGTKYDWYLHARKGEGTWGALMRGDSRRQVVAYTHVMHSGRKVLVCAWFSYDIIPSADAPQRLLHTHTEVREYPPLSISDWEQEPTLFETPWQFTQQVPLC